jgi:MFS family permease
LVNGLMVVGLQVPVAALLRKFAPLKVIALAALVYAGSYFMVGQVNSLGAMVALMVGITTAEILEAPTVTTFISMLAPQGRTGVYMGLLGLITHLGWTVGPLVGGLLLDAWADPRWMWASISLLAVFSALGFLEIERWRGRLTGSV